MIHTNQLMARSMGRGQPDQSEQMETVEVWEKVDSRTIKADVWIYDPTIYVEPWYLQRRYAQVSNPDKTLRMNYWHCGENPNNEVFKTKDGSTHFKKLTFTDKDRAKEPCRLSGIRFVTILVQRCSRSRRCSSKPITPVSCSSNKSRSRSMAWSRNFNISTRTPGCSWMSPTRTAR